MKKKIWIYSLSIMGMIFILATSCKKKDDNNNSINNTTDPNAITVQVNSVPSGVDIYLDGGITGKQTPYKFENLNVGNHVFKLHKTDYDSIVHSLYLFAGDKITINDTLKKNYFWEGNWQGSNTFCIGDFFPFNNTQFIIPSSIHNPIKITIDTQISNEGNDASATADVYFGTHVIGTVGGNQTSELTVTLPSGTIGAIDLIASGCSHTFMNHNYPDNPIIITRVMLSCN